MLATLSRLGISYDTFTKESRFVVDGTVADLMSTLDALEIAGTADNGAGFLDLGQRGLKGKTEFFYRREMVRVFTPHVTLLTTCGNGVNPIVWLTSLVKITSCKQSKLA